MVAVTSRTCVHHPTRAGFAQCMQCRNIVCQECATSWDGINYCRTCLQTRSRTQVGSRTWSRIAHGVGMGAALLVVLTATVHFLAWSLALVASW